MAERIDYSQITDQAMSNFWASTQDFGTETSEGPHLVGYGINKVFHGLNSELAQQGLEPLDPETGRKIVAGAILESPDPNHLLPGAVETITEALSNSEPVAIWTQGDHRSVDLQGEKEGETQPGHYFQLRKIARSKLRDRVMSAGIDRDTVRELLSFAVDGEDKMDLLPQIFEDLRAKGVTFAYIVDDRLANLEKAREIHATHGDGLEVGLMWVNKNPLVTEQPPAGIKRVRTIADYQAHVENSRHFKGKVGHVIDWDSTLFDEGARVQKSKDKLSDRLRLVERLDTLGLELDMIRGVKQVGANEKYSVYDIRYKFGQEIRNIRIPLITDQRAEELAAEVGEHSVESMVNLLTYSLNDPFMSSEGFTRLFESMSTFPRGERALVLVNIRKALKRLAYVYQTTPETETDALYALETKLSEIAEVSGDTDFSLDELRMDPMATYKRIAKRVTKQALGEKEQKPFAKDAFQGVGLRIVSQLKDLEGVDAYAYGSSVLKSGFNDIDMVIVVPKADGGKIREAFDRLRKAGFAFAPTITSDDIDAFSYSDRDLLSPYGTVIIDGKECWVDLHILSKEMSQRLYDSEPVNIRRADATRLDIPLAYQNITPPLDRTTLDGRVTSVPELDRSIDSYYHQDGDVLKGFFQEVFLHARPIIADRQSTADHILRYLDFLNRLHVTPPKDLTAFIGSLFNNRIDQYTPEAIAFLDSEFNRALANFLASTETDQV